MVQFNLCATKTTPTQSSPTTTDFGSWLRIGTPKGPFWPWPDFTRICRKGTKARFYFLIPKAKKFECFGSQAKKSGAAPGNRRDFELPSRSIRIFFLQTFARTTNG